MRGGVFAVQTGSAFELRATGDGQTLGAVTQPAGAAMGLSSGGEYLWNATDTALRAWSPAGALLLEWPGDYASAVVWAAPEELRVARGPAGSDRIETIAIADSTQTISPTFFGNFQSWFADGERFHTSLGNTLWIYSASGIQEALAAVPGATGGTGDNFWVYDGSKIDIYIVGGGNLPVASYDYPSATLFSSEEAIGVLPAGKAEVDIIQLGPSITREVATFDAAYLDVLAIDGTDSWVAASWKGSLHMQNDVGSSPVERLGCGKPLDIDGSPGGRAAIATANGMIIVVDGAPAHESLVINQSADDVELSDDGTVIASSLRTSLGQFLPGLAVEVFSAETGAHLDTVNVEQDWVLEFEISPSGATIGSWTTDVEAEPHEETYAVVDRASNQVLFSEAHAQGNGSAPKLADDQPTFAVSTYGRSFSTTTQIYQGAVLVGAVSGYAEGWVDADHLLVHHYSTQPPGNVYLDSVVVDAGGVVVSSPALPEIFGFDRVAESLIYSRKHHTIYDPLSGVALWTGPEPTDGISAAVAQRVLFLEGDRLYAADIPLP